MTNKIAPPISPPSELSWDSVYAVPCKESYEEIVPLSLAPEHLLCRSIYFERQIPGALPECYAREGVLERLLHASSLLPHHLRIVVVDGWRSTQVQSYLFRECVNAISTMHPEQAPETISQMAQQYVAMPMTDHTKPAPHATGGAVDVFIADRAGKKFSFGSAFDFPGDISGTTFFEEKTARNEPLSKQDEEALYNRRLLYFVMTQAGFVNFHCEWWHYEYGTQRWALETGAEQALYSPVNFSLDPYASIIKI